MFHDNVHEAASEPPPSGSGGARSEFGPAFLSGLIPAF